MPDDIQMTIADNVDTAIHRGVIPYLALDGQASKAAEFYVRAFGAREVARVADSSDPAQLMHVALEINGGSLMMTDCRAPWETDRTPPRGFNLQLVVADGDHWMDRAVAAGCTVRMPLERMFWGDRWGMVEDPFGISWAFDEPAGEQAAA